MLKYHAAWIFYSYFEYKNIHATVPKKTLTKVACCKLFDVCYII